MSSSPYTPVGSGRGQLDYSYYEDEAGYGLVTFAGVMLLIVGVLNTLYGIAAIDNANVFVNDARYVFGDLNTWGWFLLAWACCNCSPHLRSGGARAGRGGSASPPRVST